ncbi:MAG: N-acetylmuramidase domain-containing protein, partial [Nostoc sp.]|uniref:N-acetylmuramidase domain-containing protein n=1 Tax=Nostoc sp. TaxID=1180 RepID=UPI002FF8B27C
DNNYTWWHNMGFGAQNVQATVGGDGKLHVLGVGKDASTWMWNESDNNYTWWHNMGFGAQNVQATVGGDGKLHVLGVGKDASTWMWNESDNNYTWWHNMGFGAQNVQATVGGDGKLHVLGVGKDASTWMWNESDNNYTWWHNMGFGAQNVQATVGGDGKLHVLGVGKDASTWMWNESDNNYTWWHNMGFGAQNVQATVGGDGKLHVLGVGKDASTWMWNESDNNYTWWHNMGFGARQTTATNDSYFSALSSLTDDEWDTYSGDNTRFDPNTWDNGVDERSKTPDSIKQVYTDLSVAIFGSRHQMNTGYMYDKSYHDGFGTWHAGFDLEAAVGTSIKTVVGGTIAWTSIDANTGVFIGVNGDDGRQWVYGHMQSIQFAQGARIDAGQVIGVVGSQPGAKHFHLEVETGLSYGKTNGADPDQNHLRNVTVSPLQAFWQWQNKNGKTTQQTGQGSVGITEDAYRSAASRLMCDVAAIKAVASVESSGNGFLSDGRCKILFEAQVFGNLTEHVYDSSHSNISSPQWDRSLYAGGAGEYPRLAEAESLNDEAALKSASWGKFQIMGFNYAACGYNSVDDFVTAMKASEINQLEAFVSFIKTNKLDSALRNHQWADFAYGYNGSGYAANQYDTKIAAAYSQYA